MFYIAYRGGCCIQVTIEITGDMYLIHSVVTHAHKHPHSCTVKSIWKALHFHI